MIDTIQELGMKNSVRTVHMLYFVRMRNRIQVEVIKLVLTPDQIIRGVST